MQSSLQKKEEELDSLRNNGKLSISEYQQTLHDLYDSHAHSESLISEMVSRYLTCDFEFIDELERKIQLSIVDGDLERAYSLINSRLTTRLNYLENNREHVADIDSQLRENEERTTTIEQELAKDLLSSVALQ